MDPHGEQRRTYRILLAMEFLETFSILLSLAELLKLVLGGETVLDVVRVLVVWVGRGWG